MSSDDDPSEVWDLGWAAGVLVAIVVPIVLAPLLVPEMRRAGEVAALSAGVTYVAVLFADLLIYFHWRMTGGPANWLVLAITTLSIHWLALVGFVAGNPAESSSHPGWIVLTQLVVALGMFAVVPAAQRYDLRVDPILAGVALGTIVAVVRNQLIRHTEPLDLSPSTLLLLRALILLIDLAIVVAVLRLTTTPPWARGRLGCALVLLSLGHTASYPAPRGVVLSTLAVSANALASTVLLCLAIRLVHVSWLDNRLVLDLLARRLEQIEAAGRVEKARLHEIRATVAGLGTASRLIHQRSAVSGPRRRQIEEMVDSEMARLQRLLCDDSVAGPEPVDVDATIRPIVTRHRALGYPVRWHPSGERAIARADDVAVVINVLLQNAVHHAPGAGASIVTRKADGIVEIAISDSGPGIDSAIRAKLFEWGERGHDSDGSGIGLNVARQLTMNLGGYLRLVETSAPGATFVLGLPSEETP